MTFLNLNEFENEKEKTAYIQGFLDQTYNLAVWENGEMYVGVMKKPYKVYIQTVKDYFKEVTGLDYDQ